MPSDLIEASKRVEINMSDPDKVLILIGRIGTPSDGYKLDKFMLKEIGLKMIFLKRQQVNAKENNLAISENTIKSLQQKLEYL